MRQPSLAPTCKWRAVSFGPPGQRRNVASPAMLSTGCGSPARRNERQLFKTCRYLPLPYRETIVKRSIQPQSKTTAALDGNVIPLLQRKYLCW